MALTLSKTCEHDISERDVAHQVDGLCPLCLYDKVLALKDAVNDLARMLEAVRYTSGLGKGQMERIAKAKALAA